MFTLALNVTLGRKRERDGERKRERERGILETVTLTTSQGHGQHIT